MKLYPAPQRNLALLGVILVNHFCIAQHLFQFRDPALDFTLLILGSIVFRIFGQIPLGAGFLDFLCDFSSFRDLQIVQLGFQFLQPFKC